MSEYKNSKRDKKYSRSALQSSKWTNRVNYVASALGYECIDCTDSRCLIRIDFMYVDFRLDEPKSIKHKPNYIYYFNNGGRNLIRGDNLFRGRYITKIELAYVMGSISEYIYTKHIKGKYSDSNSDNDDSNNDNDSNEDCNDNDNDKVDYKEDGGNDKRKKLLQRPIGESDNSEDNDDNDDNNISSNTRKSVILDSDDD